jgi:hypothetical protein
MAKLKLHALGDDKPVKITVELRFASATGQHPSDTYFFPSVLTCNVTGDMHPKCHNQ